MEFNKHENPKIAYPTVRYAHSTASCGVLRRFSRRIFGHYLLEPQQSCGVLDPASNKTKIMGILNVTPDSFSDGDQFNSVETAVKHAKKMVEDGADIIDVGGESSRPGSDPVSEDEELRRVVPVVKILVKEVKVPISIDTYKPKVADECLKLGAHIINDISGLRNKEMIRVVAKHKAPVIIMHMLGEPKTMQDNPQYRDIVDDIKSFFKERITEARKAGIKDIIIDPGIGFGKTIKHNLQIIKRLEEFKEFECPIILGTSRKSFIGLLNSLPVNQRLEGTLASVAIGIMNGANIVRVHDVKECKRVVQIADAVKKS